MQKQVVLRDDVVKQLDLIRSDCNCSYNTAVSYLLKKEPYDLRLVEINDLFKRLKVTVPDDMYLMVEVFRVLIVRNYRRNPDDRAKDKSTTDTILEKLLEDVLGDDA